LIACSLLIGSGRHGGGATVERQWLLDGTKVIDGQSDWQRFLSDRAGIVGLEELKDLKGSLIVKGCSLMKETNGEAVGLGHGVQEMLGLDEVRVIL